VQLFLQQPVSAKHNTGYIQGDLVLVGKPGATFVTICAVTLGASMFHLIRGSVLQERVRRIGHIIAILDKWKDPVWHLYDLAAD